MRVTEIFQDDENLVFFNIDDETLEEIRAKKEILMSKKFSRYSIDLMWMAKVIAGAVCLESPDDSEANVCLFENHGNTRKEDIKKLVYDGKAYWKIEFDGKLYWRCGNFCFRTESRKNKDSIRYRKLTKLPFFYKGKEVQIEVSTIGEYTTNMGIEEIREGFYFETSVFVRFPGEKRRVHMSGLDLLVDFCDPVADAREKALRNHIDAIGLAMGGCVNDWTISKENITKQICGRSLGKFSVDLEEKTRAAESFLESVRLSRMVELEEKEWS